MKLKLLLALIAVTGFVVGYGSVANAFPWPLNHGYFHGQSDGWGDFVWRQNTGPTGTPYGNCRGDSTYAIPMWVQTAEQFINFTKCKLYYGNTQEKVGAAFIISTITGMKNKNPGATEIDEFTARVKYAESQGWMNANVTLGAYGVECIGPNTYYQGNNGYRPSDPEYQDIAAYSGVGCGPAIVFGDGTNPMAYVIRRECANPLGSLPALPKPKNFTISGSTKIVNETNAARGSNPFPGDRIRFEHSIKNNGPDSTAPTEIWAVVERMQPLPQAAVVTAQSFGTLNAGQQKQNIFAGDPDLTVNIPADAKPGTQYCQRVGYDPVTATGVRHGRGATACATVAYNFSLKPSIEIEITSPDGTPVSGPFAEPGDLVRIKYSVNNTGTTESQLVSCTYKGVTHTGYSTTPPTEVIGIPGQNCPPSRTFPASKSEETATEDISTAGADNRSFCRSFTITPVTPGGGSETAHACFHVGKKPFASVLGGDVSAGGGVVTQANCAIANSAAAIIGWNRGQASGYQGAGVQFAAYALGVILDVATSLGSGSDAAPPTGLSFANTSTNPSAGRFGGELGSVTCIPDHFAALPASYSTIDVSSTSAALPSGVYYRNGDLQLNSGVINRGERVSVYVDGDVYINGSIAYGDGGTWSDHDIPLFRLVVNGDIYIAPGVSQLDGLYVAQSPDGVSKGIIYTCATGLRAPVGLTSLLGTCDNTLTVNGSFVARQVRLLRASGSLSANTPAEVFNYNPALWIAQPLDAAAGTNSYDSITSLPPIL